MIKVYSSLDDELLLQKVDILDNLVDRCMSILKRSTDGNEITRVLEIIKHIIYETERKGTGDVQPHNAMQKGEMLDKLVIKNRASPKRNNIIFSLYSNTTVWELKRVVAKHLELIPKYLRLERQNGKAIRDLDNGKTLGELGIQNNEVITATKI